jgi:undecaprenyl-diphosphatase
MTASFKNITTLILVLLSLSSPLLPCDLPAAESPAASGKMSSGMTAFQAAILGIVEGVTEYLPVSSTGHLLLTERIMGIGTPTGSDNPNQQRNKDAADAYAICIQAGAIVAVLGLYAKRVKQMVLGLMGKDSEGLRMVVNLLGAFLPAAVLGLVLHSMIKAYLFGPWPIIFAWFAGGLAILWIERNRKSSHSNPHSGAALSTLNVRMALLIGFAQCLAMWPGVSRSLATILGGVMVGLSTSAAVEFSFLLGVMTLGAATLFDALKHGREMIEVFSVSSLSLGLITAFLSAVVSVKWMVAYLNRHGLEIFGYYRIAIAMVAAILMAAGWI